MSNKEFNDEKKELYDLLKAGLDDISTENTQPLKDTMNEIRDNRRKDK